MHTATMRLTVAELSDVKQAMTDMLFDHHNQHRDRASLQAIADINQVPHFTA